MRNLLALGIVGLASMMALAACGDASSSTGIARRGTGPSSDPSSDGPADTTQQPSDPSATSAPPPPATPGTTTGSFDMAVDQNTLQADLDTKDAALNVTVTPKDGFKGAVTLAAKGLPEGVTATFSPASVNVDTAPVTAKVTFTVAAGATPTPNGAAASIEGTSGTETASANVTFKVNNQITATIITNADALRSAGMKGFLFGPNFDGSATAPTFTSGVQIKVVNGDSVQHIVHGQSGFTHGDTGNPVQPGDTDVINGKDFRTVTANGANGYIHGENQGTNLTFKVKIQ